MSISHRDSTLGVNNANINSSDQAKIRILNLTYPSRPNVYAPWVCPPKPLVIRPTVCTRYEATFMYSNGSSGLAGHNVQSSASHGYFEYNALKWMKRVLSRHVCKLQQKVRLTKAKFLVVLRRQN